MTRSFAALAAAVALAAAPSVASAQEPRATGPGALRALFPLERAEVEGWAWLPDAPLEAAMESWGGLEGWVLEQRVRAVKRTARELLAAPPDDGLELPMVLEHRYEPLMMMLEDEDALSLSLSSLGLGDSPGLTAPLDETTGCDLVLGGTRDVDRWEREMWIGAPRLDAVPGGHTDKQGNWVDYEQIPRRWDRPEPYAAYRYPLSNALVASGYDLDLPDERQRRGKMSAVGHGGVDLAEKKGTPITMITLDHQVGDAEVIFTGHLFGETVVTRHVRREGGKKRDYVLLFGHLDNVADGVWRGKRLRAGETVGYVGDTDSPEFVHLHLEARRMVDGVDAWKHAWNINERHVSIPCDPRNVLPLRAKARAKPKCTPKLFPERQPGWMRPVTLKLTLTDAK